jgi:signal peptidase I
MRSDIINLSTADFSQLAGEILKSGNMLRFRANGSSMVPTVCDGDILVVAPLGRRLPRFGDIVLHHSADTGALIAHRIVGSRKQDNGLEFFTRGDANLIQKEMVGADEILGRIVRIEHQSGGSSCTTGFRAYFAALIAIARSKTRRFVRRIRSFFRRRG